MSDSLHSPRGPELPAATPFDPGADPLPPGLEWDAARPDPFVLLLDAAADRTWAADAAVAVATAWARAGRRVVLADLHLEEPVVHDRVGEPNLDGVVDVFLYGASLARTARPVPGRGFYLISAGTYTEEPETVLLHPRWPRVVSGFADAHASLLLFVPADAPGLEVLGRGAGAVIVLGEPDAALRERLPEGARLRAAVAPRTASFADELTLEEGWWAGVGTAAAAGEAARAEPSAPPPAEAAPEVIPWSDPYQERADPLIGEYADGIPASTLPPGALPQPREADIHDPPAAPPSGRRRSRGVVPPEGRRRVHPVLWALLALTLLGAAGYFLLQARPDLMARVQGLVRGGGDPAPAAARPEPAAPVAAAPEPAVDPAPAAAAAPVPDSIPLVFSVQTRAFPSLAAARRMVTTESRRFTEAPLFVSPEMIDRVLYYRVLAGALRDTVEAARLRERLVSTGVAEASDAQGAYSLIQFAPYAFNLGDYPSRARADARADSLFDRGIPSYPVALPAPAGSERWRLYGGAYQDSLSADWMRRELAAKSVPGRLVFRVGAARTSGG